MIFFEKTIISQLKIKKFLEKVHILCYNMSKYQSFKQRSLYFMSAIKVVSYNVHSTIGMDGKSDCRRLAAVINQSNPHVAGLQELGVYTRRVPDVNAPLEIARHTRMNYLFSRSLVTTEAGGEYGVGAVSVYTMELKARLLLPTPEGAEPRSVLIAKVNAPTPFYFVVCHFSFQGEFEKSEFYRTISAKLITDTIIDNKYYPCIWTGDLNTFRGTDTVEFIRKHWLVANDLDPDTPTCVCSESQSEKQIDFICAYPKESFEVKSFSVLPDREASDHNPVEAELILKEK